MGFSFVQWPPIGRVGEESRAASPGIRALTACAAPAATRRTRFVGRPYDGVRSGVQIEHHRGALSGAQPRRNRMLDQPADEGDVERLRRSALRAVECLERTRASQRRRELGE
jgi:hypothetical protein